MSNQLHEEFVKKLIENVPKCKWEVHSFFYSLHNGGLGTLQLTRADDPSTSDNLKLFLETRLGDEVPLQVSEQSIVELHKAVQASIERATNKILDQWLDALSSKDSPS